MAKAKTRFFCTECGHETSGWLGKCPGCGAWNTLVEERVVTGSTSTKPSRRTSWLDEGHTAGVAASGRTEVINLGQVVADRAAGARGRARRRSARVASCGRWRADVGTQWTWAE